MLNVYQELGAYRHRRRSSSLQSISTASFQRRRARARSPARARALPQRRRRRFDLSSAQACLCRFFGQTGSGTALAQKPGRPSLEQGAKRAVRALRHPHHGRPPYCVLSLARRRSRNQARKAFNVQDLARQTEGVECRKDSGVIDEAPKAYKDIRRVMEQQRDLVEIVSELKQLVCVKG